MTKKPKENIEKETTDISKMNIHEKLMNMKFELLDCDIKKSGHNKFGGFDYHELKDILPPVNRLCKKYRCLTHVDFPNQQEAILTLINVDNPEDTICTHSPRPELREMQRMNIMQSEGSYETYMRKYLYLNLFDITEPDTLDALSNDDNKTNPPRGRNTNNGRQAQARNNTGNGNGTGFTRANKIGKKESAPAKNIPKPACFDSVLAKCHEMHPDKECDKKLLNQVSFNMMNNNELTKKEREELYNYLFPK